MPFRYSHIHLVSDSTGETLINVARATLAQYEGISAIEHVYPLVRSSSHLDRVLHEVEMTPGLVLYTLANGTLAEGLEDRCRTIGVPSFDVLKPVHDLLKSYFGTDVNAKPGAQHTLNAEYFRRIDAMNFTLAHDDGNLPHNLQDANVIVIGVSRTSKTPTCIYLANRGIKAANVPFVLPMAIPKELLNAQGVLIVGLIASPDRIVEIRKNRVLNVKTKDEGIYTNHEAVSEEILECKKLFIKQKWPVINVTYRSIEETAAAIIELHREFCQAEKLDVIK